jgi:hypothetical protein
LKKGINGESKKRKKKEVKKEKRSLKKTMV